MSQTNPLICLLFVFFTTSLFAQLDFEQGYFIDNKDIKTNCLIKNQGWRDNPTSFEYKLRDDSDVLLGTIENIKEFGLSDYIKYERHTVEIDRSSDIIAELTNNSSASFSTETLFLKKLVEGQASLFIYEEGSLRRFFMEHIEAKIKQLVYKRYKFDGNRIGTNYLFRQQLRSTLDCEDIQRTNFRTVAYNESHLVNIFRKYNSCSNSTFIVFKDPQNRDILNLTLKVGLNQANFSVANQAEDLNVDLGGTTYARFGAELEITLPIQNNKWALFIDPSYQKYETDIDGLPSFSGIESNTMLFVEYSTLEIPVGLRHYMFLNKNLKLFANVSFAFVHNFDSELNFQSTLDTNGSTRNRILEVAGTEDYVSLGVGLKYKNGPSMEVRYNTNRDLLGDSVDWTSDFTGNFSVIVGYTLF